MKIPTAEGRASEHRPDAMPAPGVRRLLLVTPVPPANVSSGAGQRTALMLEALEGCGTVDVLHLMPGKTIDVRNPDNGSRLPGGGVLVEAFAPEKAIVGRYRPQARLTRAVETALGRELGDYDTVVGRYAWGVCQLEIPAGVRVVADLDDFRYRYSAQASWNPATCKERVRKWLAHVLQRRQLARFDSVFFVSPLDRDEQSGTKSVLLPNIPFAIPEDLPVGKSPSKEILFVGSLWYRPNAEGVDWFLRHAWPRVRAEVPEATLTLVGAAPSATRAAWAAHSGVQAPGFVDDLAKAYADAALVIAPIHSGGGTNIKVLEAIAHAKPCLISGFTHAALSNLVSGLESVLVADDAKNFAACCIRVLNEAPNYSEKALQAKAEISIKLGREAFFELVRKSMSA